MNVKSKISIIVLLAMVCSLALAGCGWLDDGPSPAEENENKVLIDLDLGEDIGLLLMDYQVNDEEGKSGISNADRSLLQRDSENLLWSFYWKYPDTPADAADVSLRFIVVTEYFDPDYAFDYPEEYLIPMDALSFSAAFGKTYRVTITGDRTNGYQAAVSPAPEG